MKDTTAKTISEWKTLSPISLQKTQSGREWIRRYNGIDSLGDNPSAMDFNGNLYIAGISNSKTTNSDIVLLKYNPQGVLEAGNKPEKLL